jgi:hypothetical protein
MIMLKLRLIAMATAVGFLASCAGTGGGFYPQVLYDDIKSPYYGGTVALLGSTGGATRIYGAPANDASAAEIIAPLYLPPHVADQKLSVAEPDVVYGLHLALVFAPQTTTLAKSVCRGEAKGGIAGPQLKVLGVFCQGTKPLSEAVVIAKGSPVPGDPAYARALNQMIYVMMPLRNPDEEPDFRLNP